MKFENSGLVHPVYPVEPPSSATNFFNTLPIEGVAFVVASFAIRIFSSSLTPPLLGMGISILTTKLVLKTFDCYDSRLLINLTKETCKFNKNYPKLQMIIFICSLMISFVSATLSFLIGACLGTFGSIILDVESYKLLQQANRKV